MKKSANRRALLASGLSLILCVTTLLGSTFAWFTDAVEVKNNIIQSGNLDVALEYKNDWADEWKIVDETSKIFDESALWEPGHTEVAFLRVSNAGSLALKYNLNVNVYKDTPSTNVYDEEFSLADYIEVGYYVQDEYNSGFNYADLLIPTMFGTREAALNNVTTAKLSADASIARSDAPVLPGEDTAQIVAMVVTMPTSVGNEANHKTGAAAPSIEFGINLVATQLVHESDSFDNQYDADAEYPVIGAADEWDGTSDSSWYNEESDEFIINTAEELAGLADLVDDGNSFEGKTVKLGNDIDLYYVAEGGTEPVCFEPIGSYRKDTSFKGTFDGQGYTISNMSQNTWALNNGYSYGDLGLGLFGKVENATIKDLTMDGASISGESALAGIVAGAAYGDMTFENITVTNSQAADYQYYSGGIVGWASGDHQYINCDVDASTTIAAQWGDFDNSTGGIIGGAGGSATIYLKDCDVACRIDAYNDVTSSYQWYAYRRCGMLIGDSGKTEVVDGTTYAAAPQLTCENVTVTYGDWANYTYCEFAGTSWPYVRVQAGVSNSAYSNPRYGHPTDANGNEVVDDSHVHNDGEDHFILCEFDQLYGGGQGVYGGNAHDGVTVIYNNK